MLDLLLPRRCVVCRAPGTGLCHFCATSLPAAPDLAPPPGIEACWSLVRYDGTGAELVAALKFAAHHDAVGLLGQAMARLVDRPIDVVTWAPTSPAHRRRRGFDQAEVLARSVSRHLDRPCRPLLTRTSTSAQTGSGRAARLSGPAFVARRTPPARTLVVDDVRTTGATLCAAADAMHHLGTTAVSALTLAVAP